PWGDNPVVRYFYDGLNRRVKKDLTSGTDVIYLYDGWRCIEEREDDGGAWEARRQYVYGGTYIDEPLIFDKDTDGDGDCTDAGGSSRFFYCQQANFNVVALAESDGDVVEKIKYDPYGEYTFILDGSTGNTLLFQGQRYDAESGLYYFRNRYLSPVLGSFLQRDPHEYGDGMHLYLFAHDAPVGRRDPLGLWELKWKKPLTGWELYYMLPAQVEPGFIDCGDLEGGMSSVVCLFTKTFRYHFERKGNFKVCQCDLDVIHGDIRYTGEKFEVRKIDFKLGIPLGYGQEVEVSLGHWVYWTDYEMGDKRREARRGECLKLRPRPEFEGEPAPGERDKAKAVGCPE
ncbi:MAG TPA: RHS repeat-associated core domain-containing protein, partial [Armatimonadota bacterium]|nr:RHS repeat-associated core domain-containing protein [Armatimonadota bacterium]